MNAGNSTFFPQLDSLRTIAVLLVISSHWLESENILNRYTDNGVLGVTLFFVLSGFLITNILLKYKNRIFSKKGVWYAFKIFYLRRALRIFPIYYLLLFMLFIFNISDIRESFMWHFFYASNFYFWIKDGFIGSLAHLWSLSVEEQFYLIWPALILLIHRRYLTSVFVIGIVISVLFRTLMVTPESEMTRFLMPATLDSFCIGGLLAYGRLEEKKWYMYYRHNQNFYAIVALLLLVIVHLPIFNKIYFPVCTGIYLLIISISFGVIINRVADNIEVVIIKQILNNKILLFLGKISYGIYLYHNFVPQIYDLYIPNFLIKYAFQIEITLRFSILLVLATLSWYVVEKPLLAIKSRLVI